ncbi:phosphatidylglycerophosphatase A [Chromobacterium sp. Beijing]|uniref:phosphatidylglycerophosphatase A family protein n=1 Tax=Chromobacterium sp. Beijing TaxID=2735795 RepID=UPI001F42536B|nr:phosphatidylglycerophosphatase A [Chromobacterium sp. Beijing]UJB30611.1 phosphatidylglycerophosphatase A [Chromobacterium sp. Beijing]
MTISNETETLKLQPDWRFVLSHPAHFLAFGFGSGLARKAPGTWGTVAAYPLFFVLNTLGVQGLALAALCLPLFIAGIWICGYSGRALGVHDYGGIVWDEIVAMLLVLAFAPATPLAWLLAFVLFRFFDILKPWPIRWLDRHVGGGFGVMVDDLLAALFALAVQWGIWRLL